MSAARSHDSSNGGYITGKKFPSRNGGWCRHCGSEAGTGNSRCYVDDEFRGDGGVAFCDLCRQAVEHCEDAMTCYYKGEEADCDAMCYEGVRHSVTYGDAANASWPYLPTGSSFDSPCTMADIGAGVGDVA